MDRGHLDQVFLLHIGTWVTRPVPLKLPGPQRRGTGAPSPKFAMIVGTGASRPRERETWGIRRIFAGAGGDKDT